MAVLYPNGIGGSLGPRLATCKPLQVSGNVWYVHHTGTNAVSPAGQNREKPLASLAQAHTNAAAGDTIVCLSGHTQVLTATQTFNKAGITLVGEGSSSGKPTVKFQMNHGSQDMFVVSAAGVRFSGLWIQGQAQASAGLRIWANSTTCEIDECYIECGAFDLSTAILAAGNNFTLRRTTIISTAVASTAQPLMGVQLGAAISDVKIEDCVFDGGTFGFSNYAALDLSAQIITRLKGEGNSFLRGADYVIHASTIGYFNPQTASGGVRGAW